MTAHDNGGSSLLNNVDICAAILSDKAPKLPLREELNSLGFEVVLSAAGTGLLLSKDESTKAVKKFRKAIATKDLKKRRFFPKNSTRIKEVLHERKRMEHELGLPHAFSYETYDIRLRSFDQNHSSDNNNNKSNNPKHISSTASLGSGDSGSKNQRRWNMIRLRKETKKSKKSRKTRKEQANQSLQPPPTVTGQLTSFEHMSSQAMFPDALVSSDDSSDSTSSSSSFTGNNTNTNDDTNHSNSDDDDDESEYFSSLASTTKSGTKHPNTAIPIVSQRTQALQQLNNIETGDGGWDNVLFDTMDDEESASTGPKRTKLKRHQVDTTSPLGQDIVPDVFGAFDMMDDDFSGRFTTSKNQYNDNESIQSSTIMNANSRIRMDPDGTTSNANTPTVTSSDPPTVEALLLQYSMSGENKEYSSPTSRPNKSPLGIGEPYFQEEKKEDDGTVDPLILAFGNFAASHPLDTPTPNFGASEQAQQQHESIQDVLNQADQMTFPKDVRLHDSGMEERVPVEDVTVDDQDDDTDNTGDDEIQYSGGTVVVPGTDVVLDSFMINDDAPPLDPNKVQEIDNTMEPSNLEHVLDTGAPADDSKSPLSAFERATAEILRVAGIETSKVSPVSMKTPDEKVPQAAENKIPSPKSNPPVKTEKKNEADWMKSAKTVFDNFSTGVLKVAGIETNAGQTTSNNENDVTAPTIVSPTSRTADISALFESIVAFDVPTQEVENRIITSPDLTQVRRNKDGRLPLHALCDRGMPDRSGFPIATLTDYLLRDVTTYQSLINVVVDSYPPACLMQDKNFDLPVHLIARRLMEWEATWYEIVYQKAAKERNASGATASAITKLYQTMSTTIEKLLLPLVELSDTSTLLCQTTGSMGTILPLHIASIFTVSVRCLRLILEAYPEAAAIPCDLGILHTFIPDECLPLELHDNLSTDSPKWEIELSGTPMSVDSDVPGEDGIRRSDLLFAYNPIEPHRLEKPRIRRLESRINFDALTVFGKVEKRLDRAHERVWVWMCSFREPDTGRPTYVNCVKRIISSLPIQSIRYLVSVTSENGAQLMDIASTECLKVIQMRLEQLYEVETPLERKLSSEASVSAHEKEVVGQLCRLVFNVPDASFPTSFIILPYMLSQEADGSLRLASPESANVAFQFAECLLNLTDPRSILFILDAKSKEHYGQRLYDASEISDFHLQELERVDAFADSLRSLYESGDAFLYLVDESTGLPRIDSSNLIYPITLTTPATLVEKLLPLMMMSMVQMRGEKAIPKLATVLLDENVANVPPNWAAASDLLISYLTTPDAFNVELSEATDALRDFRSHCSSRFRTNETPRNGISEWNAELSILKMIIEINDPDRTYAGLTVMEVPEPAVYDESFVDDEDQLVLDGDMKDGDLSEQLESDSKETFSVQYVAQQYPEPDIIDLSRKMDALSELQLYINRDALGSPHELSPSFDDDNVLVGDTFSVNEEFPSKVHDHDDDSDAIMPRKNVISRYSLLFNDLANSQPESVSDPSEIDNHSTEIRVWNAVDRVWEDVTYQLNSRAEIMYEDSQILQLKVALAEQAKKLSELGKKVSHLKDEERRLTSNEADFYDLTDFTEYSETGLTSRDSVSGARKLVMRMEDLEERLICNEIEIQHLSMEAFSVEHSGEKMINSLREAEREASAMPKKISESTKETSGISWGSNSTAVATHSQNSFLRYEKKMVRFNDDLTSVEFVESPEYEYSTKGAEISTPIVVLDDYMNDSNWQYPIIELIETAPSTPSTYNSSASESDIDPSGKVIYISTSRDPEGSYMGPERPGKSDTLISSDAKSQSSVGSHDQRSSQALSGNSGASSGDRLSNAAVATLATETPAPISVYSVLDAESSQTSEQSFNSMLLNILNSPTAENTVINSLPNRELSFSPGRTDDESRDTPSRYQKLMAVKKKKSEKSPRSSNIDPYNENPAKYRNYDRVFPNSDNSETVDSVNTSDAAVVEEAFRPTPSIAFTNPLPQREISAMSSDKSLTSSVDLHSARKVLEIERLITKYTSNIDMV